VQNAKTLGKAHRMGLDERKLLVTRQRKDEEANAEEAQWHYRSKQMQLPDDVAPDAPGAADYQMPRGF